MSDLADLLRRCASGDRAALRDLYDGQAARLRGVALRITRDPMLADDVLHDLFVNLEQTAGRFDPSRGSASVFLTMTTRFAAMEAMRRRRREPAGLDAAVHEDTTEALLAAARADHGAHLAECLERLDPRARRMILLAFVEGRSHAELSRRFAMPAGTVKSVIRRGLAALRRCLEP